MLNGSSKRITSGLGARARAERDPLLLPARQRVRVLLCLIGQVHQRQHFVDAFSAFPPVHLVQSECHVLGRGEVREQRVVLEDHAQPAFLRRHVTLAVGHRLACDAHRPCVRLLEAGDQAQRGGFAAAARPQQHHDLAAFDHQRQALHIGLVAVDEVFDGAVQFHHRRVAGRGLDCRRRFRLVRHDPGPVTK